MKSQCVYEGNPIDRISILEGAGITVIEYGAVEVDTCNEKTLFILQSNA